MTALIQTLHRLPRALVAIVVGLCLLAGLLLDGLASALFLAVVLLLMVVLTSTAWPALRPAQRVLRVLVLAVLAWALVTRLT
ncbi:MAG TPA: DUF6703 family protein [Actinomycetales bacterium]|nr:DUF6703 family protein [Actinomycetales bacterium]